VGGRLVLCAAFAAILALALPGASALARGPKVRVLAASGPSVLKSKAVRVRMSGPPGAHGRVTVALGGGRGQQAGVRRIGLSRRGNAVVSVPLDARARQRLRKAVASCRRTPLRVRVKVRGSSATSRTQLSGGNGCVRPRSRIPASGSHGKPGRFQVGAAVGDFTPPPYGTLKNDPSDCDPSGRVLYPGPHPFAFMEPYVDLHGSGHYDAGDPFLDCNGNGRWDGNFLGGGSNTPRYYDKVADPVTARAVVVSNGSRTTAVEVVDQEGLFNTYMDRIRKKLADDGFHFDGGVFISATHDESAPDTLGLGGATSATSGVNDYFVSYLVDKSAQAIEDAYRNRRAATVGYADAAEPQNMRQCWSSYPFVDDMRMPVMQAVGTDGNVIATLASVNQHAETLGFNGPDDNPERTAVSADWPHFFRQSLEQRYGGVAIEMAGSVGSVESPEVFPNAISRVPQQFVDESHPAGCRTLFNATGTHVALGYNGETQAFGEQLAGAVEQGIGASLQPSSSNELWGERAGVCLQLANKLFAAAAAAGVFANRPAYNSDCTVQIPPTPTGNVAGTALLTNVSAFRIGDGEFLDLPGEVFPFTYKRSFLGPQDMPKTGYDLPPWLYTYLNAPYRVFNGLADDMVGYIFPQGNGVGVPGEDPNNPSADSTDRFGCGHSDDSEAASSTAGDDLGKALVPLLQKHDKQERVVQGRYVLPSGAVSRDPQGGPVVKCNVDQTYHAAGNAVAVDLANVGIVHPAAWMALDGRPQSAPDRDTRGYFTASGERVWLDVFPDVSVP
jgi:hypothetical protein